MRQAGLAQSWPCERAMQVDWCRSWRPRWVAEQKRAGTVVCQFSRSPRSCAALVRMRQWLAATQTSRILGRSARSAKEPCGAFVDPVRKCTFHGLCGGVPAAGASLQALAKLQTACTRLVHWCLCLKSGRIFCADCREADETRVWDRAGIASGCFFGRAPRNLQT